MEKIEIFRTLCLDESGNPKDKNDCRATLINHLILDEMLDIDEAEEKTDEVLHTLGLWQEQKEEAGE